MAIHQPIKSLLIAIVRLYQLTLSSFFRCSCRFTPTCSDYAIDALQSHGALKGLYYATSRLLRCHPWHAGGYDPVPSSLTQLKDNTHAR